MLKKVLTGCITVFLCFSAVAQDARSRWVDSVFHTLSASEKVGQLFVVPVSAYATPEQVEELMEDVKNWGIGGIIITRGGPYSHARLVNQLQSASRIPLLTGIHAEWGLGQTLDSTMSFYKPLLLSALPDSLVVKAAKEIGRQMNVMGLHLNFAPNADNDIKDENYPLSLHYFSDNKHTVTSRSLAFLRGLQSQQILSCAPFIANAKKDRLLQPASRKRKKTGPDSTMYYDVNRIDTLDFYSYRTLMENGLTSMLTSHLHFSMGNKKQSVPAPVSQIFFNDILKKKMNFQGLTFAEIPYLQKIMNKDRGGETELLAFMAGNDVLIDPQNRNASIRKIQKAVKKNAGLEKQLDASVKKILAAKYDAGLNHFTKINTDNLTARITSVPAQLLKHQLAEAIVTTVKNDSILPITSLENKRFASLCIGKEEQNEFHHYLSKYAAFSNYSVRLAQDTVGLRSRLAKADVIVVGVFPIGASFESFFLPMLKELAVSRTVIICHFGDPYSLKNYESFSAVIAGYDDDPILAKTTAQIIFGGMASKGALPVSPSATLPQGQQIVTSLYDRFTYTLPEEAGMDSKVLDQIKSIAREAIDIGATPGCHVFIARHGKVVYEKSFGWFTYENKTGVTDETIYDLASVTKVSATLQTVMFMQEKGLIDINKKASYYLPELRTSNKKDFIIKDIITHQAGLWPFLPFWATTVTSPPTKQSTLLPFYYSQQPSEDYPFPVADSLFAFKNMKDSLWQWIIKSKIVDKVARTPYDYRYSDMGFYIMQHLAEKLLNQPMEDFLEQNLYEPLGAYTTGFLPRRKFAANRIAPTEDDQLFRKQLLTGYVHDQGAAMHGGIAGHAGLFSTANDLAKLGQMLLNKGHYGGIRFYKPETVELFTARQFEKSRRGLGWDKPIQSDWNGPTSVYSSARTFGHTGFTGTCIWVDPEFDLVYVFLSNRVYPDMTNNKLLNANIRPRIQDVIYKSIFNYCAEH